MPIEHSTNRTIVPSKHSCRSFTANFYIQVAECSVLLKRSRIWGKGKPHAKEANRAIVHSTILNSVVGFFFYIVSVTVVNILTHPLDNRTNQFVVGVSQVFAAIVFLMMSIHVPQWFGIYHSNKNTMISYSSGRGIRFNLTWNLWKQIFSMYFFALYFACADFHLSLVWGAMSKSRQFELGCHILAL